MQVVEAGGHSDIGECMKLQLDQLRSHLVFSLASHIDHFVPSRGHVHVDFAHINSVRRCVHLFFSYFHLPPPPSNWVLLRLACCLLLQSHSKSASCAAVLLHSLLVVFTKPLRLFYSCIGRFVASVYFVVFGGSLGGAVLVMA